MTGMLLYYVAGYSASNIATYLILFKIAHQIFPQDRQQCRATELMHQAVQLPWLLTKEQQLDAFYNIGVVSSLVLQLQ